MSLETPHSLGQVVTLAQRCPVGKDMDCRRVCLWVALILNAVWKCPGSPWSCFLAMAGITRSRPTPTLLPPEAPALPTLLSHSSLRGLGKLCLPPSVMGGVSAYLAEIDLGLWPAVGSMGFGIKGCWATKDISLSSQASLHTSCPKQPGQGELWSECLFYVITPAHLYCYSCVSIPYCQTSPGGR